MSRFSFFLFSSLGKKYLMAVSGFFLGGFLLIHAAGNSSLFWGRKAFLSYADHLHSLGILLSLAEWSLAAVFLLHITIGILLFFENNSARHSRYAVSGTAGGRTWGSRTMPYTGLTILAFIVLHLFNFHFTDGTALIADTVGEILAAPLYSLLYFLGMGALGLHVSHGFWSLFQSLGINHPLYNQSIKAGAMLVAAMLILVFTGILLLLLTTNILTPQPTV